MIIASCSTILERRHLILEAVNSIRTQVNKVIVHCGYENVHKNFDNVTFIPHDWKVPDQFKFNVSTEGIDYHLTFDDDILYPKDYVIRHIDLQYRLGYVISTVHGSIFRKSPITNFFKDRDVYHYKFDIVGREIDLPGTGTLCYQPKKISFPFDYFEKWNMTDIYVALRCKELGQKIAMLGRNANWLRDNMKVVGTPDLYSRFLHNHQEQTDLANKAQWK